MMWFGPTWGAPVCDPSKEAPCPTASCAVCGIGFVEGMDQGVILPFMGGPDDPSELPYHLRCFLSSLGIHTPPEDLVVRADHRAWSSLDDDDWNGATFLNWLRYVRGKRVVLYPPPGYAHLDRFIAVMRRAGAVSIVVE